MKNTAAGCDAELISFPLAAERYGADPKKHVAQVLSNPRNDGAPAIVVAIPPLEVDATGKPMAQGMDTDEWLAWALNGALEALHDSVGDLDGVTVLLYLEAVGMAGRARKALDVIESVGLSWKNR
ncbi:hypothetical protein J2S40_003105 [Nocardioides luteus]|uniref:hypothetical protein n=1 Tax=Nocardioides luteus TaxID=1844 RepID=UPI00166438E7|nr:hypothetical protein [Nocardioides luteus]MDR7312047.1 hypothetical protein [Nocardioides luteus]